MSNDFDLKDFMKQLDEKADKKEYGYKNKYLRWFFKERDFKVNGILVKKISRIDIDMIGIASQPCVLFIEQCYSSITNNNDIPKIIKDIGLNDIESIEEV